MKLYQLLFIGACLFQVIAQRGAAQSFSVSTPAGLAGSTGNADGVGPAARFFRLHGVAVDTAGNVYVADTDNHCIRKVAPDGTVTTLAGSGTAGSADGTGAAASFNFPIGIAVDGAGDVFVADTLNQTIRQITPAGVVTTLAGTAGMTGTTDGTGASARFNGPNGVAVDSAGDLYVADTESHVVRKITTGGVVTTLAGTSGVSGSADGTGSAASFNRPYCIAVDSTGNLYVGDRDNSTIRKITSTGDVTTLAGLVGNSGSADGTGGAARFNFPLGIAVDSSGDVFVADYNNHVIRRVTQVGVVTTIAGAPGSPGSTDGLGPVARFRNPIGLAVDSAGALHVGDAENHTLRKVTPPVLTTLAGTVLNAATGAGLPGVSISVGTNTRSSAMPREPTNCPACSSARCSSSPPTPASSASPTPSRSPTRPPTSSASPCPPPAPRRSS